MCFLSHPLNTTDGEYSINTDWIVLWECKEAQRPRISRSVPWPACPTPLGALRHVSGSSFLILGFCKVFEGCAAPRLSQSLGTQHYLLSGEGLVCRELSGDAWAGFGSASKLCLFWMAPAGASSS